MDMMIRPGFFFWLTEMPRPEPPVNSACNLFSVKIY